MRSLQYHPDSDQAVCVAPPLYIVVVFSLHSFALLLLLFVLLLDKDDDTRMPSRQQHVSESMLGLNEQKSPSRVGVYAL